MCRGRIWHRVLFVVAALGMAIGMPISTSAQLPLLSGSGPSHKDAGAASASAQRKWIGVACAPLPEALRAHLDVPQNQGLLVLQVVSGSPAEQAGLARYDVLLAANDQPVKSIEDLVKAVSEADEEGVKLTWMHAGKIESKVVKPVQRPRPTQTPDSGDVSPEAETRFQWRDFTRPFRMRVYGSPFELRDELKEDFPKDLRINIEKQGNEPARIRVQKEDKTWEVTEEQLDQLPEDVRPFVERFVGRDLTIPMPSFRMPEGELDVDILEMPQRLLGRPELQKSLDQINRRIDQLQEKLEELRGDSPEPESSDEAEGSEAPNQPGPSSGV